MKAQSFAEIAKDTTAASVHTVTAIGNEKDRRGARTFSEIGEPDKRENDDGIEKGDWSLTVPVTKVDAELQVVYGWASVIEKDGAVVTDHQGDQITEAELVKAAHAFMTDHRVGGVMHWSGARGGDVVESVLFTRDLQKALGIDIGKVGWLIGYRVTDPELWRLAKSGKLSAFSIGGRGVRVPA